MKAASCPGGDCQHVHKAPTTVPRTRCAECGVEGRIVHAGRGLVGHRFRAAIEADKAPTTEPRHCEGCSGSVSSYATQSNAEPCSGIEAEATEDTEAVNRLNRARGAFDVIDNDCGWPEMHGKDFADALSDLRAALVRDERPTR